MPRQDGRRGLVGFERAGLELAGLERALHRATDGIPVRLLHVPRDAAVRNDLDPPVDELHIDQHAAVLRGVPDAKLPEHLPCALARRDTQMHGMRRPLDVEAYLAAVRAVG